MRLEIVFSLEEETKELAAVDYIELMNKDKTYNLDWDESTHWLGENGNHHMYAKGVQINQEYGDGKINKLMGSVISHIQVYNYEKEQEEFSAKIHSLEIYDEEATYAFPKTALILPEEKEEITKYSRRDKNRYI